MPQVLGVLAAAALEALRSAISNPLPKQKQIEERNIWQPDSWLIQRCCEALADGAHVAEALAAAHLAARRSPLAPIQTIYRLSQHGAAAANTCALLDNFLGQPEQALAAASAPAALLLAAASALQINDAVLTSVFLERLDQLPGAWEQLCNNSEQRLLLGQVLAGIAPHPLAHSLLRNALRRFGDAGADLVHQAALHLHADPAPAPSTLHKQTPLQLCVDVFRYGMLTTPYAHRRAIAVFARAGLVDEVLQQMSTLSAILEARRAGGIDRQAEQNLLRQVKRPTANSDADVQVQALSEAIRLMPQHSLTREQRIALANQLALLGRRSDGWTAASAASILAELGALKFAGEIVAKIAPDDPTRSEAVISFVRALLEINEPKLAAEQTEKGIAWAHSVTGHRRERALIRGLGEVYLEHDQPEMTLHLLDRWRTETGLIHKVRRWLNGAGWDDDTLRNQALRLRALLHPKAEALGTTPKDIDALFQALATWGAQLLEGEALITFYADALLRPLFAARRFELAWRLLPQVQQALSANVGAKHAARVSTITSLLARYLTHYRHFNTPANPEDAGVQTQRQKQRSAAKASRQAQQQRPIQDLLAEFLINLWQSDAQRGVWQVVHGIEGSLPLLLALEGPGAVAAIAQAAPSIIGAPETIPAIDEGSE